jgi:hypothetical protein
LRIADSHEVARLLFREQVAAERGQLEHLLPALADRQPADRVAVEVERRDLLNGAASKLGVDAALGYAEEQLAGRARRGFLARGPQRRPSHGLLVLGPRKRGR